MNADQSSVRVAHNVKDISGQKFNRLTVKSRAGSLTYASGKKRSLWLCVCDCGNEKVLNGVELRSGAIKSCGCLKKEHSGRTPTHGMTHSSEFKIWSGIKTRTTNPKTWNYASYGGRGIKMCDRWMNSFEDFLADVGPKPYGKATLDRFPDQNGNYEPTNTRWTSQKEQCRNKRNNHLITYKGETLPLAVWTERLGFRKMTLRNRIVASGWSIEEAMETPENDFVLRSPRGPRRTKDM